MGDFNMNNGGGCCGAEQSKADIREHMEVIASCGHRVGVVDRVEGETITLTKRDSTDGRHHRIPMDWVAKVDEHVHLSRNSEEVANEFEAETIGSGV